MDYNLIELTVTSGIATLTLNRPDKRNAMSDGMRSEFIHALESVTADKAIRALVLTGAGKGFCAGGDISWHAKAHECARLVRWASTAGTASSACTTRSRCCTPVPSR